MSDSNIESNPFIEAKADKPDCDVKREDCWWGMNEEDTLYDAYLILRDAGYTEKELEPLGMLVERTTIYKIENMEWFFEEIVKE